jgi:hypothetical protein
LQFLSIDGVGGGGIENQLGGCFGLLNKAGDALPVRQTEFMLMLRTLTSVDLSSSAIRSLRGLSKLEHLNHLCLADCTHISAYALSCLPQFRLPCLSTLVLFNVEAASDETCAGIVAAFPTLSHLDLTKTKAADRTLEAVGSMQAHAWRKGMLETLNLRKCTMVTDEGLRLLAEGFEVTTTGLMGGGGSNTSSSGAGTSANVSVMPKVRRQSRRWSKREFDHCGKVLVQSAPAALPIDCSCQHSTGSSISLLSRLDLMGCKKITDTGLWHLCQINSLTALDLSWCDQLTSGGEECLHRLRRLRYLSLLGCHQVTDGVVMALKKSHALECLNLKWCRNITDTSLIALSQLPKLRTLCLKGCESVTDEGVTAIAKKATLTALNLSLCKEVSYKAVEMIRAFCDIQELLIAVSPDAPSSEFVKSERSSYF